MIYELLAHERVYEAHREAEKARLVKLTITFRDDQSKRLLIGFLCRVGLITAC
jgi:hypothetical protein